MKLIITTLISFMLGMYYNRLAYFDVNKLLSIGIFVMPVLFIVAFIILAAGKSGRRETTVKGKL